MKADICLATNWDNRLIEGVAELNQEYKGYDSRVYEFYGGLKTSLVGGGRPSVMLPDVTWNHAKDHVDLIHSMEMKFNYLLNSSCMGNREFYPKYHQEILDYLDKIVNLGADLVTIANPYIVEVVRDQYPDLKIVASTFCHIDSMRKAMFFEDLGVDRIILANNIRRKFGLFKNIRRAVKCDIEILATSNCIYGCPYSYYHMNTSSHASQSQNVGYGGHFIQHPMFHCNIIRLSDPAEFIRSPWIRPEDIDRYLKHGINFIKLEGRQQPTWNLLRGAKAYLSRKYNGNVFDLLAQNILGYIQHSPLNKEPLAPLDINIESQALDGFLDFFEEGKCSDNCNICNYCEKVAEKVVSFDPDLSSKYIESAKKLLRHMSTSEFMKDFVEKDGEWKESAPRAATMDIE